MYVESGLLVSIRGQCRIQQSDHRSSGGEQASHCLPTVQVLLGWLAAGCPMNQDSGLLDPVDLSTLHVNQPSSTCVISVSANILQNASARKLAHAQWTKCCNAICHLHASGHSKMRTHCPGLSAELKPSPTTLHQIFVPRPYLCLSGHMVSDHAGIDQIYTACSRARCFNTLQQGSSAQV